MNFSEVYLKVKDHSVSGEEFELLIDKKLQLLKTHPQPDLQKLPDYYNSEDYISHTDGNRSLFEKIYQAVKRKTITDKVKLINKLNTQKTLLDIGAGTGDFLLEAERQGWSITGIEPSENAKNIAVKKGIPFTEEIEQLPDNIFDVITMWHVLEHIPDTQAHIKQLKRILKKDGVIVVAVPNFKSYDAEYYGSFWAAYDVPRHLWHFSKTAIEKLFNYENIKLEKILPMYFDSFYVSLLSEKYKNGKMNFLKGFITGLKSNLKARKNFEYSSHIYVLKNHNI